MIIEKNRYGASTQTMKKWKKIIVALECIRLDIIMTVIFCYLERENYKVLKFQINNFSYFEISASLC